MRMILGAATIAALALAACASTPAAPPEPKIVTRDVPIAVPVPCAVAPPPAPAYPDTAGALAAAGDVFAGVQLLEEGRLMRIQRIAELEAALTGCAPKLPP